MFQTMIYDHVRPAVIHMYITLRRNLIFKILYCTVDLCTIIMHTIVYNENEKLFFFLINRTSLNNFHPELSLVNSNIEDVY